MRRLFILIGVAYTLAQTLWAGQVQLHCWIVRTDAGSSVHSLASISNKVSEVNALYRQVCMSFDIASVSYTNNTSLTDVCYTNDVQLASIYNITNSTGGIEVYFVNSIDNGVNAFAGRRGVVVGPNGNGRTIGHELGHVCGLRDIYDRKSETTLCVTGLPSKDRMPDDFGWYPTNVTQEVVVKRMLMYGFGSTDKADLTFGDVYGLGYTSTWNRVQRKWDKHWFLDKIHAGFGLHGNRNPVSQ